MFLKNNTTLNKRQLLLRQPTHFINFSGIESSNSSYIYFLRTQRRYNKMRYSRTKRYSRVSFFASLIPLLFAVQRLEYNFTMVSVFEFKFKWVLLVFFISAPLHSLLKLNIYGVHSAARLFLLYYI